MGCWLFLRILFCLYTFSCNPYPRVLPLLQCIDRARIMSICYLWHGFWHNPLNIHFKAQMPVPMKKLATSLVAFVFAVSAFAQGNLTFFSEGGETFHVILNGQRYNDQAQTNVKVSSLAEQPYQCKIIFADAGLGTLDKKVYPENGMEVTYQIKRKAESDAAKGWKKMKNHMAKDLKKEFDNDTVNTAAKEDWYVMRLFSKTPIQVQATQQVQTRAANNAQVQSSNVDVATNTTRQTTTVTTNANPNGERVNMSVNMNIDGMNTSMDVQASDTYSQQTTTTTTTTEHYVMPGYTGEIGCPWPMSEADFGAAVNSVRSKDFEDSKLTVAKQVASGNCLFASQVRDMMMAFDFEDTKLEFAKFAYRNTYDQNNYFKVNDAFDFESSIEELNRAIGH